MKMYTKHGIVACLLRILRQKSMFHTFPTHIFALFCLAQMQVSRASGLSSYLVWVGVKFSNAKEEELLINDASQIGSKKFDFSIE